MIKYFCDRCGKEVGKTIQIKIPKEKLKYGDFRATSIGVCDDCKKEFDKIIDKLTDIRFILFDDFME
jgi:DNA-directed RNA polymerase subunit RPC12/RpoP